MIQIRSSPNLTMASFNYFQGVYCRRIMKIELAEYFDRFFLFFFYNEPLSQFKLYLKQILIREKLFPRRSNLQQQVKLRVNFASF